MLTAGGIETTLDGEIDSKHTTLDGEKAQEDERLGSHFFSGHRYGSCTYTSWERRRALIVHTAQASPYCRPYTIFALDTSACFNSMLEIGFSTQNPTFSPCSHNN